MQDAVRYSYTPDGQLAWIEDARGKRTTYEYDGFNRAWRVCYPGQAIACKTASSGDFEEYLYSAAGELTSARARDGQVFSFQYDDLGRLTLRNAPGAQPDVSFAYDNFGRTRTVS